MVEWHKHLLKLKPQHFKDPPRYLFTLDDGKVLSRDTLSLALKGAALRLRYKKTDFDVVSLRAGGASAMYHAGCSAVEIQRRGCWASDGWKIYIHEGRTKAKDIAGCMAEARFKLM